ncbi:acetyl-CoA carboxylase biotin carboxyl carrier protein [Shinella sp.]|uniref:acetyl-CoA carboxylase biotin carboxyl carrier protein n=1 Tax=Shinella sp. TaxID=1870904 RepID=UPI002E108160
MADPNIAFIKSLMDEFSSSPLLELKVRAGDFDIHMVRSAVPGASGAEQRVRAADSGSFIEAPFSGIVYLASSLGEAALAPGGHVFSAGDKLLIFEAMKTMTPVLAKEAGEVEAVLVEDGAYIETGTRLLRYRPAGAG